MLPPKNRQYLHVPPCTLLTYHIITLYGHVLSLRYRHPGGGGGGGGEGGRVRFVHVCLKGGPASSQVPHRPGKENGNADSLFRV